ncbi:hypothetical protein CcCBS67573_g03799 [Chytriomyces confervae]|uniref:C3H1-type domain-containing protein n=1 Tax=Chytriomyces confervae TaxID=246404 RepID=A0A507FF14_9FUNG|nr:Target of EGR1, member 1 (Nuclear) [Chytriomyces hyalinus]TPX74939.1 hypothetical protein CcCBS67573_g03799 [Chytriomyces confervae]
MEIASTHITRSNLATLSLRLRHVLNSAEFVSVDTEFTGLGTDSKTRAIDLRDRYAALREVAVGHALVALGLVAFERTGDGSFKMHCFSFILAPMDSHKVSPSSMAFLVDHGFDFNAQIRFGIPYKAGNDSEVHALPGTPNRIMRDLFTHILSLKVPIVIHNGLLDLMFMYQSFYAELPADLDTFVADLSDMFPAGIVDTKYISDYVTRESSSFLAYLFRKYERLMTRSNSISFIVAESIDVDPKIPSECLLPDGQLSATLSFRQLTRLPDSFVSKKTIGKRAKDAAEKEEKRGYCFQYASHGYCPSGPACVRSHDLDVILDAEEAAATRNKKRKSEAKGTPSNLDQENGIKNIANETALSKPALTLVKPAPKPPSATFDPIAPIVTKAANIFETYHSACFDAYMTGYVFCHQRLEGNTAAGLPVGISPVGEFVKTHGNKLYLMGKTTALNVVASSFSKRSKEHLRKRAIWDMKGATSEK